MSAAQVKTVILYNRRKVRPETLAAIANADHGDMIEVEPEEMTCFLPLAIFIPATDPAVVELERRRLEERHAKQRDDAVVAANADPGAAGKTAAKLAQDRVKQKQREKDDPTAHQEADSAALDELERIAGEGDPS